MGKNIVQDEIKLSGLTCNACETTIENRLKKMVGVIKADVSYKKSVLNITYNADTIKKSDIIKAIVQLDYGVKEEILDAKVEVEKNSYYQFLTMGIIIFGLYLIIKHTIGFNFIPEVNANMGYGILFAVGLMSSLHCIAMCGGINLSVCLSYNKGQTGNSKYAKFIPSFLYQAGRVVSYTIIGGIVGAIGSVFSMSNTGNAFIAIVAGAFMVIMGLNMLNLFPWLRRLNPHMPKAFARKIHSEKKNKGPFVVGLLNGLMPCGPLQAMQLYALGTGSFLAGAFSMFLFSLGTVPIMFAFGALGSLLSSKFSKNLIKVSAMLVILLGFAMVNRGIAFSGLSIGTSASTVENSSNTNENMATVNGDIQEITTTLESGSYPVLTVQKGVAVRWTIQADAGSLNGCNGEIIIPEYNIQQKLNVGETVIEFVPTETGKFGYSCWMGMIRSSISVIDDQQNPDATIESEESNDVDDSGLPAGCCG